jgi:transposase
MDSLKFRESEPDGANGELSLDKIFNYILYVLHTGIQWEQLKTNRKELHYTNVYKWHNRWSKAGSYQALFEASVMHLHHTDQLDTSVLHGDGSNTVVKKGAKALATPAINTRKATKSSPS